MEDISVRGGVAYKNQGLSISTRTKEEAGGIFRGNAGDDRNKASSRLIPRGLDGGVMGKAY